jgi:hypothetical protein
MVNDTGGLLGACLGGGGIAQLLEIYARPLIEAGTLVQLLPDWADETFRFTRTITLRSSFRHGCGRSWISSWKRCGRRTHEAGAASGQATLPHRPNRQAIWRRPVIPCNRSIFHKLRTRATP